MEASHLYGDIIDLPHPVSRNHPQMPLIDRAAQFAPFAALTGYDAAIVEAGRLTDAKRELSEEKKAEISQKLNGLKARMKTNPALMVIFFEADARKAGGRYKAVHGLAIKIDPLRGLLELADGTEIPFEDILDLE